MSRTWQICSIAVNRSLGTPSHEAGAQWTYSAGNAAKCCSSVTGKDSSAAIVIGCMSGIVPALSRISAGRFAPISPARRDDDRERRYQSAVEADLRYTVQ